MRRLVGNTYEERFHSAVDKTAGQGPHGDCWEWRGSRTTHGYGEARFDNKKVKAHRLAWQLANGREPQLHILHSCDNPPCVNPSHLREGTHQDNMRDRDAKGRLLKKHPNAAGELNHQSRLTADAVLAIRKEIAGGKAQRQVARQFGVTQATISHIHRRERWAHI